VTIGSIADRAIFPENGAYAPAKHALRALHEVLREELNGTGVRATLVSPGSVDTTMWNGITFGGESRTAPTRDAMLRPEDVAAAVLYALTQPPSVNVDELRLSHS
jgi:NADP-dependent 3-hydroxy acid dehydrogenase YdfG